MAESGSTGRKAVKEAKLPKWDWVLLPMLSLLTICLIPVSTELISRWRYSTLKRSIIDDCMVLDAPPGDFRTIPNSVCWNKTPESPLAEYRFNSCGHRAGMECEPKPKGTFRIVMAGSSIAMGWSASREETFAALLPVELSRQTGRKVELYNEGMFLQKPKNLDLRFNAVLAAKPDLVLWVLTPWDIQLTVPDRVMPAEPGFLGRTRYRVKEAVASKSIPNVAQEILDAGREIMADTSTGLLLEHFLYKSQSQYVKSYLRSGDVEAGFLKNEQSARWQSCLRNFEMYAADIELRANTAGVPLVAVLIPNRAQAAMLSTGDWPADYDPYKLDSELRTIITRHGGIYVDILPDYRDVPNPEEGYFPVNGHPNAEGHATISRLMAKELTGGAVPALRVGAQPLDVLAKEK